MSRYLQEFEHAKFSLGEWRRYKDGIWETLPELAIKKECLNLCAQNARGMETQ